MLFTIALLLLCVFYLYRGALKWACNTVVLFCLVVAIVFSMFVVGLLLPVFALVVWLYAVVSCAFAPEWLLDQIAEPLLCMAIIGGTPYKKPILQQKQKREKYLTRDSVGILKCRVKVGANAVVRYPLSKDGIDYSPLPLLIKLEDRPLFDPTLDLAGSYTLNREGIEQCLALSQVDSKYGERPCWQRQHWSYYHMDSVFMGLLAKCAHEQYMLYHGGLSEEEKTAYGYLVQVKGKLPDHLNQGNADGVVADVFNVWLPRTFVSFLVGTLLTDGSLSANNRTSKARADVLHLKFGPTPLAMDLALFGAAIMELCGFGKGFVTLHDLYKGPGAVTDPSQCFTRLTHQVEAQSISCRLFDSLFDLFYIKVGHKKIKVVNPDMLVWFDPLALSFALLCDGGAKRRHTTSVLSLHGQDVNIRDRMHLSLHSFSYEDQQVLAQHLGTITGYAPLLQPVLKNGNNDSDASCDYLMTWNSAPAMEVSKMVVGYYPSSCPWKMHNSAVRIWDQTVRFERVSGAFAMDLLNNLWLDGSFAHPLWLTDPINLVNRHLLFAGVNTINWSNVFAIKPMTTYSIWHHPGHMLTVDQLPRLNRIDYA